MGRGQHDWRWWLKKMRGHLRHAAVTVGTGGDEIEVGAASQVLPWVQAVRAGASLSRGPGTWSMKMYFFTKELGIMFMSSSSRESFRKDNKRVNKQ